MKTNTAQIPFFLLLTIFTFFSCKKDKKQPNLCFYYWKKDFSWAKEDSFRADALKMKSLYVKFFDVKNLGEAQPVATLNFQNKIPTTFQLVPVVYIENEVFKTASPTVLANKVFYRIEEMLRASGHSQVAEYQIDCDWTTTTKVAYFDFLKNFKNLMPPSAKLSTTIRLHQIKYAEKTGVPPADKGLLMFYNMSDVKNMATENSILDNREARKYMTKKAYSLPLDFALPVFEWSVLFQKNQFAAILSNINSHNINQLDFLQKQKENYYSVKKDTLLGTYYLRPTDLLRHEYVTEENLKIAALMCNEIANQTNPNIIFFHWDKSNFLNYENTIFQKTVDYFE